MSGGVCVSMATKCSTAVTMPTDSMVHMRSHRGHRHAYANHRKSAVELLAASKKEYVKSSEVLKNKQELKHPENLSVGNSEIISLCVSPIRHSGLDDVTGHIKDSTPRKISDDRGQCSTFQENNNTVKNGPTNDQNHIGLINNASIPVTLTHSFTSSESQHSRKSSLSKGSEDQGFQKPTTPPILPLKPVIHPKPGSALKSRSPPLTGPKPVSALKSQSPPLTGPKPGAPPKPPPRTLFQTPGKPIVPPRPSRKPVLNVPASSDLVDSAINNMASKEKLISGNGVVTNSPEPMTKRFSSVSAGAAVSMAREHQDKDSGSPSNRPSSTSSGRSRDSRHSLSSQNETILKPLCANSLSTSVGVLVERQRSPLPKPRMGKQLEEPELPPRRQLHRSHSDLSSCRHSRTSSDFSDLSSRLSRTSTEVERFFNEMGIDRTILEPMRKLADTRNKDLLNSLSSLESIGGRSMSSRLSNNDLDKAPMESEQDLMDRSTASGTTSVVERNARIIKWLCNVKKAKIVKKPLENDGNKS